MTPQQVQIVRDTFPLIEEVSGPMTQLFYGRLFERQPAVRAMFHGNIEVQGVKFATMLAALVDVLPDLESCSDALRAMGQRHSGYGVFPSHYPVVTDALLWALGQTLESEFTPEVKAAWSALISEVAALMSAIEPRPIQ